MDENFKKLSLQHRQKENIPPKASRRQNLLNENDNTQSTKTATENFMSALNKSLGQNQLTTQNIEHNSRRRISPGRLATGKSTSKSPCRDACRHIPPRDQLNFDLASHRNNLEGTNKSESKQCNPGDENIQNYQKTVEKVNNPASEQKNRIINYNAEVPRSGLNAKKKNALFSTSSAQRTFRRAKATRHIPMNCDRVLDAPGMRSDYYINPLDWSIQENILAVALGATIYLWNAETGDAEELNVTQICDEEENQYISALKFIKAGASGTTLAIGISTSDIYLFDIGSGKKLRKMTGHIDTINALDWNRHILTSSCKDGSIFNHDVRSREHKVGSFLSHTEPIPGLAWSPNEAFLASGSNDNLALIWDNRMASTLDYNKPLHTLSSHIACVKAVAWHPTKNNLLATGGGTADRKIRIWNAATGNETMEIETNSQVCSILWSKNYDELISSHGYQMNQLSIWGYPNGKKIVDLFGHEERVLHLAQSPDGSTVVSGSEDETLRFWKVFEPKVIQKEVKSSVVGGGNQKKVLNVMPKMR